MAFFSASRSTSSVGLGGTCPPGENVEIGRDFRLLPEAFQRQGRIGKILGDAPFLARQLEHLVQSRLADVQSDDNHFFAHVGKADGKVARIEALAFARSGGSEKDDLFARAQHILHVGADGAVNLFHQVVLVLPDHDGVFLGKVGMGHVADYRDAGYLLDIGPGFNPELEEVAQVEESHRSRNAQYQGNQVVHFPVGRYRSAACHRRIDDTSVVGGSGKG